MSLYFLTIPLNIAEFLAPSINQGTATVLQPSKSNFFICETTSTLGSNFLNIFKDDIFILRLFYLSLMDPCLEF